MKASDYIAEYLIEKGVSDVFGYPGGMVTHLMDSFGKYSDKITAHTTYHEQGAAFAACGYAQASGRIGVAYATSGPGATNLITGICHAYFDSVPVIFITGQVNTFESKADSGLRQKGFQETDIVSIVRGVTKYAKKIDRAEDLKKELDYAFFTARDSRMGPVLLDIPMNIFRAEIEPDELEGYCAPGTESDTDGFAEEIIEYMGNAEYPLVLVGQGVKTSGSTELMREFLRKSGIPAVSTMLAVDVIDNKPQNYGFIGAYGHRAANFIAAKCDLLISFGARLDVRQVGGKRANFAPDAKIVRIDVDANELDYGIRPDDITINTDVNSLLRRLNQYSFDRDYSQWTSICNYIKEKLDGIDDRNPNRRTAEISAFVPDGAVITTDVGQNQVWIAQSFDTKSNQKMLFSGSSGAMGYSLPAAVGAATVSGGEVYSFNGDGGLQMNIQELQTVAREKLPVKIIVLNNNSLGMIRHFQEMYFNKNYVQTVPSNGYTVPDLKKIAQAYGLPYKRYDGSKKISENPFDVNGPQFIEIVFSEDTYVFPKLEFGKPNQDQEPLIDREAYRILNDIEEIKRKIL